MDLYAGIMTLGGSTQTPNLMIVQHCLSQDFTFFERQCLKILLSPSQEVGFIEALLESALCFGTSRENQSVRRVLFFLLFSQHVILYFSNFQTLNWIDRVKKQILMGFGMKYFKLWPSGLEGGGGQGPFITSAIHVAAGWNVLFFGPNPSRQRTLLWTALNRVEWMINDPKIKLSKHPLNGTATASILFSVIESNLLRAADRFRPVADVECSYGAFLSRNEWSDLNETLGSTARPNTKTEPFHRPRL